MVLIKPPKLKPGDVVGIVSPSWGGAGAFPHRVEQGVRRLEKLGFKVAIAPHALNQRGYISDSALNRASDIIVIFENPEVKAIIAAIGGDHSCHLLPHLDFDLISNNPKIFMGYMDYENMGVLEKINGLLVGRPMDYSDEEKQQLREVILARTKAYEFPIITDMDFGHTAPQFTLPIGCRARIDSTSYRFEILESAMGVY